MKNVLWLFALFIYKHDHSTGWFEVHYFPLPVDLIWMLSTLTYQKHPQLQTTKEVVYKDSRKNPFRTQSRTNMYRVVATNTCQWAMVNSSVIQLSLTWHFQIQTQRDWKLTYAFKFKTNSRKISTYLTAINGCKFQLTSIRN